MIHLFIVYIIMLMASIVIWFFLNRASVRSNRMVELLESIDKKNRRQVELLTALLESSTISLNDEEKEQLIIDYFHEAKIVAENLILSDGQLNEDSVIKFAKFGNKYIEKEQEKGKDVNDSIVSFTMLKNQKFSVLSPKDRKNANELYKNNINFS